MRSRCPPRGVVCEVAEWGGALGAIPGQPGGGPELSVAFEGFLESSSTINHINILIIFWYTIIKRLVS
jgi:hypothetical protein